jgi:hypothetical protein
MKLLYSAEKFRDEGFPDYLERLSCHNGFGNSSKFKAWLRVIYTGMCITSYNLDNEKDCKKNCVYTKCFRQMKMCSIALEFLLRRSFDHSELNFEAYLGQYTSNKICVYCWATCPYRRYYWRHKHYNVCHTHGERLVTVKRFVYSNSDITTHPDNFSVLESSIYNCSVRKTILTYYPAINLLYLEFQVRLSKSIHAVLVHAVSILNRRFKILANAAYSTVTVETVAWLPLFERLEKIADLIISIIPQHERIVKVVLVICVGESWLLRFRPAHQWMHSTAYSIHPLFHSYLFGVEGPLFYDFDSFVANFKGRSPLYGLSRSDNFFEFLVESGIISGDELPYVDQKETKVWMDRVSPTISAFKEYSADLGINIFDREIIQRS